jgi:hypothetical protein
MSSAHNTVRRILAWGALCALLSGCSRSSTERNVAPNVSSSDYRRGMVQWHQQHDRRPASPALGTDR